MFHYTAFYFADSDAERYLYVSDIRFCSALYFALGLSLCSIESAEQLSFVKRVSKQCLVVI